jgi:hypothetical protein
MKAVAATLAILAATAVFYLLYFASTIVESSVKFLEILETVAYENEKEVK